MSDTISRLAFRLRQGAALAVFLVSAAVAGGVHAENILNGETIRLIVVSARSTRSLHAHRSSAITSLQFTCEPEAASLVPNQVRPKIIAQATTNPILTAASPNAAPASVYTRERKWNRSATQSACARSAILTQYSIPMSLSA